MTEPSYKLHQCPSLPKEGVDVVFESTGFSNNQPVWSLIIRREATQEDLEENSYLENVGDTIWETRLEISHCPYCGEALGGGEEKCEGRFVHIDSSGWTGKRQ